MTPDATTLRSAARALVERAGGLEAARAAVSASLSATTWEAASAARLREQLAHLDARARTGVDELRAGGHHLRQLAEATEGLERVMRAAWSARQAGLRRELQLASADPLRYAHVPEINRDLARLPPPTDAYWSTQVSVPSVPAPFAPVTASSATFGPYAPPLVVRVDVAQVRALANCLSGQAINAEDVRARSAASVALPLPSLNAYGLPGSRAGGFLADATSPTGDTAQAAAGWGDVALRARALAGLVEKADGAGVLTDVLNDSRAESALDLAVLLASTSGDEEVGDALLSLSDADAEWALEHVPGLQGRLASTFPTLEMIDVLNGLALAPSQVGRLELDRAGQLGSGAKDLKALRNLGTPEQRAALRAQRNTMLREMRAARSSGLRYTAATARVPGATTVLRLADARPFVALPVLRYVPALSVGLTGLGYLQDTGRGMSPVRAGVKNVGSTAAGLATTALVTGAVAGTVMGSVALAPIVIGVAAGAAVGYGVGKAIEHSDEIAEWGGDRLEDAGEALSDVGGDVKDGLGEAWGSVFG